MRHHTTRRLPTARMHSNTRLMATKRNTATRDKHRKIIARDQPPCHWCGDPIDYTAHHHDPRAFQIDHVTPLDRGGEDVLDNLVPSHRACNRAKSNKIIRPTGIDFITDRDWT